ncbi:hypothetical protein [Streptomyces sp. NPDC094032]|uniref:hypothetical protein n=1 Tax=Streptomyces sp. NPDC094032 TaxID=3155308 RepID=UPI003329342F
MTLYGRAAVLDTVVPSLVGLGGEGAARERIPGGSPLLIECGGGRLTGKTALLTELSARYAQRIPQAYADLGAADFGQPGIAPAAEGAAASASRTLDLLFYLSDKLSQKAGKFSGRLSFPRLTQGLVAATGWQVVRPAELPAARRRLEGLIQETQPDPQARRDRVAGWITEINQGLAGAPGLPLGVNGLVAGFANILATELLGPRADRHGLAWWARRGIAPQGDEHAQLAALAMSFHGSPTARQGAERHLLAAFLEDMADHYTRPRVWNRVPRPLLLLDNVHTELGQEFLGALTRAWHDEPARMRPGVVVTALTAEPSDPGPEGTPSTRASAGSAWRGDRPATADGWVLRLPLARLELEEIEAMFDTARPDPDTVRLIHRLSAGRAGIAHTLVEAVRQRLLGDGPLDHRTLLDLPIGAAPGQPVYQRLLRRLVPQDVARSRLTYYAAALDDGAARRLSADYPPDDPGGLPVQETRELLHRDHGGDRPWPGTEGPFVGDPTLRALFAHELRTRAETLSADGEPWRNIHLRLRARYTPDAGSTVAGPPDIRALHHSLAIGDTETVVNALHHSLADQDASAWLASLNLVCAAPYPPRNLAAPATAPENCPACAAGGDPVHEAVRLLVVTLWKQSHPLAVPDPAKANRIRLKLLTLTQQSADVPQEIFYRAHAQWPSLLNDWHQAPELPTYEGPHA